jgi:hypothetical protein
VLTGNFLSFVGLGQGNGNLYIKSDKWQVREHCAVAWIVSLHHIVRSKLISFHHISPLALMFPSSGGLSSAIDTRVVELIVECVVCEGKM